MNPLKTQVGGDHYKQLAIQPIEFAHANQLPPCIFSALKYIVRYASKGKPVEDLKKAVHFCELQLALDARYSPVQVDYWVIDPMRFCALNKLSQLQTQAILGLCSYLFTWGTEAGKAFDSAISAIESLIANEPKP